VTPRLLFVALLALAAVGQDAPRFRPVDVFVEADRPLAAYQIEIECGAKVVGVEGGAPAAFREPPRYDPAALQGGRIVLAAFTLDEEPPRGRIRVARLHMMESGPTEYEAKLVVAAAPGGEEMTVRVEAVPAGDQR